MRKAGALVIQTGVLLIELSGKKEADLGAKALREAKIQNHLAQVGLQEAVKQRAEVELLELRLAGAPATSIAQKECVIDVCNGTIEYEQSCIAVLEEEAKL